MAMAGDNLRSAGLKAAIGFSLLLDREARYWRVTETLAFWSIPWGS